MGSYGGEPRGWRRAAAGESPSARTAVPGPVSEALSELRQLTRDPVSAEVERALADLGQAPDGAGFGLDTVRQLRQWSAEYQRVAIDLEAAARCCRLVEREINRRVDTLLSEKNKGRTVQFRDIFRRARTGTRNPSPEPEPVPGGPWPEPVPGGPWPEPGPARPAADIPAPDADIVTSALGPLEVHVAGRRVPRWTSLKARAVFQYLLIHQDRPIRRDVLMALQWPDHSHNSARNNLNVALYSLRNTLEGLGHGVQPVLYRDGCYILNPELNWWIDRNEFLSAVRRRTAGAPGRTGPSGSSAPTARPSSCIAARCSKTTATATGTCRNSAACSDLYGQALEGIAEINFRLGELADAQEFGQLALGHDPCSESVHRLLMRCYASQHQQQLVSRQYRVCVEALRDELGVSPSDETTRLFRELI